MRSFVKIHSEIKQQNYEFSDYTTMSDTTSINTSDTDPSIVDNNEICEESSDILVELLSVASDGLQIPAPLSSSSLLEPSQPIIIRVIPFSELLKRSSFPRYPNDRDIVVDARTVDAKSSLFIFVSHCWLRGWPGAEGYDGKPHPDNAFHSKYLLLLDAIKRVHESMAHSMEECYIWFDYGCLNQDSPNPALELQHLDKIMQMCDCVITPLYDEGWQNWSLHLSGNIFTDYRANSWRDGENAYLQRAWCRMEMLYAASIPLRSESRPGGNRYLKFTAGLKVAADNNRRPHVLYGSREYNWTKQLLILPPLRNSYFHIYNPLEGHLHYTADMEKIKSLMEELKPYIQAEIEEKYEGSLDSSGCREGYGKLRYSNGDRYEGNFHKGMKEGDQYNQTSLLIQYHYFRSQLCLDLMSLGYGTLYYSMGDVYRGAFFQNLRHGNGMMQYANGDCYIGEFSQNYRNGRGVLRYANGNVFEGFYGYGTQKGPGRFYSNNGDFYEGQFRYDTFYGKGRLIKHDGTVEEGRFVDGLLVEKFSI